MTKPIKDWNDFYSRIDSGTYGAIWNSAKDSIQYQQCSMRAELEDFCGIKPDVRKSILFFELASRSSIARARNEVDFLRQVGWFYRDYSSLLVIP